MAKKKSGRSTGRHPSARRKSATGRRPRVAAKPRGRGDQLIPVICSECHDDFLFDTSVNCDEIVCPICEHSASKPDGARLHHIAEKRRQEKSAFTISAILSGLAAASFMAWAVLMKNPANAADDAMFWGPLGVAGLSTLILFIFIFKYEGNRWETYF